MMSVIGWNVSVIEKVYMRDDMRVMICVMVCVMVCMISLLILLDAQPLIYISQENNS